MLTHRSWQNARPAFNGCVAVILSLFFGMLWLLGSEFISIHPPWNGPGFRFFIEYNSYLLILFISALWLVFMRCKLFWRINPNSLFSYELNKFYSLLEKLPSMALVIDLKENITFINRTLPEYTPSMVMGRNFYEFVNPGDIETIQNAIKKARETGQVTRYEAGAPHNLGSIWFSAQVQPLFHHGKITHLAIFLTDISDRRQMEIAFQESESRYKEVVSSLPGMVYQFTRSEDGKYRMPYVSSRVRDLFHVSEEQAIADVSVLFDLVHPADKGGLYESIEKSSRELSQWRAEFRIILDDGQLRWIRGSSLPRSVGVDEILWNGVLFDITAEKVGEIERRQLEKELQQSQKLEALGTLAGGIAHDFNNFLQIISTSIELAHQEMTNDNKSRSFLEKALETSTRGRELIRQILAFCRNEELEMTVFDISFVLEEFLEMIQATAPPNVRLDFDITPSLNIFGNQTQIQQILLNLLTNAFHVVKEKIGHIRVSLRLKEIAPEETHLFQVPKGKYVELSVKDNGRGMNTEEMERIFDPFFTTKPPREGTGLGLSVVHGLVKSHGGGISVESEVGKGTCFRVHLPLVQEDFLTSSSGASLMNKSMIPAGLVLLIEDEIDLMILEEALLENLGHHVLQSSSGEDALEQLNNTALDIQLVISDNSLPGMTGLEVLLEIRRQRNNLPFILISGHDDEDLRRQARTMGISNIEILSKPFSREELKQAITRSQQATSWSDLHPF